MEFNYDTKFELILYNSRVLLESEQSQQIFEKSELIKVVDLVSEKLTLFEVTEELKKDVIRQLETIFSIKHEQGIGITMEHKKWFLDIKNKYDFKYWGAYKKYLENDKGFTKENITKFEYTIDDLTDLLGNPKGDNSIFKRSGLVIGDVQSGKTANFIGLINRAVDIGFKMIVVLTGTTKTLRNQTQIRTDEGFCGFDSESSVKGNYRILGVGRYRDSDETLNPVPITMKSSDFDSSISKKLLTSIIQVKSPVIAVVKKNKKVLENLNNWLRTMSGKNGHIDESILVIDDEADYASLNTNKSDDEHPTAINGEIRKLLKSFNRSSYVGFTATPYANVFVDPDVTSLDYDDDLFPKDFIYCLDAPSNYIGARNIHVIEDEEFNDNKNHSYMVSLFDDLEERIGLLPLKHKKDFKMSEIPKSLQDSIYCFIIANAIRDIRASDRVNKGHRSMLINVSTFKEVHKSIYDKITVLVEDIITHCRIHSKMPNWKVSEHLANLFDIYNKEYAEVSESWDSIKDFLKDSTANIKVYTSNSDSNKNNTNLVYEDYKNGARAILIGGFSLSRGITVEGLTVSYIHRSSKNYDTLLQMGRWFGYKHGYEDLCRVWMSEDLNNAFKEISDASDELRLEVKEMSSRGGTPNDFGLKVRTSKMGLAITARNKMKTGKSQKTVVDFSGDVIETHKLHIDYNKNTNNIATTIEFMNDFYDKKMLSSKKFVLKDLQYDDVFTYLRKLELPYNDKLNIESLYNYTKIYEDKIGKWDLAVIEGNGQSSADLTLKSGEKFKKSIRKYSILNDKIIQLNKSRLGSIQHGELGLSEKVILEMKNKYKTKNKITQKTWFRDFDFSSLTKSRNPLICIYFIELGELKFTKNKNINIKKETTNFALSIGIPMVNIYGGEVVEYVINKRGYEEVFGDDYED